MNNSAYSGNQGLRKAVLFSLFATSYTPLFALVICRQLSQNIPTMEWSSEGWQFVGAIALKFGLTAILLSVIVAGVCGLMLSLHNIKRRAESNARPVTITTSTNRSGEAISYIGTYILPFVFNQYDDWFDTIALLFLLAVIYRIYINSSLLLINPLLNMWYTLYEVSFVDADGTRSGMMITKNQEIGDGDDASVYGLGKKLYYEVSK